MKIRVVGIPLLFIALAMLMIVPVEALGSRQYHLGACSDPMVLNQGIRTTITVVNQKSPGLVAYWVSEWVGNIQVDTDAFWVQTGYGIWTWSKGPIAFYWIFDKYSANGIAHGFGPKLSKGPHVFTAVLKTGTTWSFQVDGIEYGTYDLKHETANDKICVTSEVVATKKGPIQIKDVLVPKAIEYYYGGLWHEAGAAYVGTTANSPSWSMAGNVQNPKLGKNQLFFSARLAYLPPGTWLWAARVSS